MLSLLLPSQVVTPHHCKLLGPLLQLSTLSSHPPSSLHAAKCYASIINKMKQGNVFYYLTSIANVQVLWQSFVHQHSKIHLILCFQDCMRTVHSRQYTYKCARKYCVHVQHNKPSNAHSRQFCETTLSLRKVNVYNLVLVPGPELMDLLDRDMTFVWREITESENAGSSNSRSCALTLWIWVRQFTAHTVTQLTLADIVYWFQSVTPTK